MFQTEVSVDRQAQWDVAVPYMLIYDRVEPCTLEIWFFRDYKGITNRSFMLGNTSLGSRLDKNGLSINGELLTAESYDSGGNPAEGNYKSCATYRFTSVKNLSFL